MVESARLPEVIHYDVPKPETKIIHKTKVIKKPVPVVHYVDYPVKKSPPEMPEHLSVSGFKPAPGEQTEGGDPHRARDVRGL